MKTLALSFATLLLLAGCAGGGSVDFSVDNPTDAPLRLKIDGADYEIAAHQAKALALKAGEHSLEAPATGPLKFIVYAGRKGGLINPTLSDYVIVSETYVTEASKAKNFMVGSDAGGHRQDLAQLGGAISAGGQGDGAEAAENDGFLAHDGLRWVERVCKSGWDE